MPQYRDRRRAIHCEIPRRVVAAPQLRRAGSVAPHEGLGAIDNDQLRYLHNCGSAVWLADRACSGRFHAGKHNARTARGREIAGVLNLRGRIVTVIDLANRLQLDAPRDTTAHMVIGIERGAESFGILVDRVGEVLSLADRDRESAPINLDYTLSAAATGVFRLDEKVLVALDADRMLDFGSSRSSAAH